MRPRGAGRKWAAFASFAGAYLLSAFLRSSNAVLAGELTRDLGLTPGQLGFMTAAFLLPFAAAQLPLGHALDRYGARTVVPALMGVAVVGTLVVAIAPGFAVMTAGRAAQGLGLAGILVGGFKALSTHFPGPKFAFVSAELVAFGAAGALLAGAPLAWASSELGWRTVFALAALALAVLAAAVARWGGAPFPGRPTRQEGFRRLFGSLRFWRLLFVGFVITGSLLAIQGLWAGPYLTEGYGLSQATAGTILMALNLGLGAGYLLSGWFGRRYGHRRTFLVAFAGFLAVQVLLALRPPGGAGLLGILFLLFGLTGSSHVLLYALGAQIFPDRMTGHVVTAVNLAMFTGGFALQSSMGLLVQAGQAGSAGAYGLAFVLTAALSAIALVVMPTEP